MVLTHNALQLARLNEYRLLGQSLRNNTGLLVVDLSENRKLEEKVEFHEGLVEEWVGEGSRSGVRKWVVTGKQLEEVYLRVMDRKRGLQVWINGKVLADGEVGEEQSQ